MRRLVAIFFVVGLVVLPLPAGMHEPIKVEGGLISGTPGWAWNVREYLGIPFAAAPVGNLRWKAPQPVAPWQGVLRADHFSPACMQLQHSENDGSWNRGLMNTSEDCLYLNVWTPASIGNEKLPVMVWIYGGGGTTGSTAEPIYDGNAMAKNGVVVVSMNYRVNVLGWMAHPELTKESEHHASGNYGSLDQLAAIKWVHNNIAAFGGDPDKVTIWGESGGSRSVNFLDASPLLKGFARAAIAESHTSFGRMTTLAEAESAGVEFQKAAGKSSLADLRAMPAQDLLDAFAKHPSGMTGAIVDGWFLPEDIYTIYSEGKQNDIALLTGGTNDEGGSIAPAAPSNGVTFGGGGRGNAPATLAAYQAYAKSAFGDKADTLLKLYPATDDASAARAYHDVNRDINFAGHLTWAKLQTKTGKAPAYIYIFSHIPPHPSGGNGNNPTPAVGAVHFSDVIYVFNNFRAKDLPWSDLDRKVADSMGEYWSNFAKNLNPNGEGLTEWPVYNPDAGVWMNIGDTNQVQKFNKAGVDFIASVQEDLRRSKQ